jgi:ankyrin repeat protein
MVELDREGRLPLHYTALENKVAETEERLALGDDPNLGDRRGFTPLHLAVQQGAAEAARVLLDHGAEVDKVNIYGNTALSIAVFYSRGRGDLIALLRGLGADPLKANNSGQTPVGTARLISNYDVAQFFRDIPD